jgi:hypothetical protein
MWVIVKMPPKAMKVKRELIDMSKPVEQFRSMHREVGSDYDAVMATIKENEDCFTKMSNYTLALNPNYNSLFDNLLECYEYRKDVKVISVDIQRTGYNTNESTHYELVTRGCMRIIVVVKERGFTSLNVVLQGKFIPISILSDGLYAIPPQMSELSIYSGNTIEGKRLKACKALYINFVVQTLSDNPSFNIANEFCGVEMKQGGTKSMERLLDNLDKQGIDKAQLIKSLVNGITGNNDAPNVSLDNAEASANNAEVAPDNNGVTAIRSVMEGVD